ncbi:MAG: membrane protein insertion efficiency factor YidD [Dermatophilaceae bacterium]
MTVGRVFAAPLVLGVRLYQQLISPLRPATCRFYPSCSAYTLTALNRFGPIFGGWLAIRRLGRCNPWNPGGVDPVPMTWAARNDVRPEDYRPDRSPGDPEDPEDDRVDAGLADRTSTTLDHPA